MLPYGRFLAAAEACATTSTCSRERFGVSFETVCHRLSTHAAPRRAAACPFFFVRVDRAGNISKRQSATDFHFSRTGGTCPLWNVYEAFAQPGKVLTQLARMPDGRTYLWIARTRRAHRRGGYGSPERIFAVGAGLRRAPRRRLVYAKGLACPTRRPPRRSARAARSATARTARSARSRRWAASCASTRTSARGEPYASS